MGTKSLLDLPHFRGKHNKKESILHKFLRACCVKPLIWYARKSDLLEWYHKELDFVSDYEHQTSPEGCTPADPYEKDAVALLSLYHFLTKGEGNWYAAKQFDNTVSYKPLSPLTFQDNEFNKVSDNIWQNKRISSVFKEKDGTYRDIDAIGWESAYYVDLNKREIKAAPLWYGSCHVYSSGVTWIYDDVSDYMVEEKDRWMPLDGTGIFKNFKKYQDTERHYLQCVEMNTWEQDPTTDDDTKGEWRTIRLCFLSSIPKKYLERFELKDAREDALKDETDMKSFAEDLDYIQEHHLEKFLYRLMNNNLHDYPVEVSSDDRIFEDDYMLDEEEGEESIDIEEAEQIHMSLENKPIQFTFKTEAVHKHEWDKAAQDVIYRLIDDYNVSEEAINVELDEDNIFKKMTITVPLKTYAKIEEDKLFEKFFKK